MNVKHRKNAMNATSSFFPSFIGPMVFGTTLLLLGSSLQADDAATLRADVRATARIATGVELRGSADGSSVTPWDTTALADGWTTLTDGNVSTVVLILNGPAVEGGRLVSDATWNSNRVHVVRDDVVVPFGKTLFIAAGTVVKFTEGAKIVVEEGGSLVANGALFADFANDAIGGDVNMDGDVTAPTMKWGIWTEGVTDGGFIRIPGRITWHVDAATGSDSNDGLAKASAFATIQKAIDSSTDGDFVIVSDGIYNSIITTNRYITISSENGPETTIIDGDATGRCAFLGQPTQTNSVICGFTFRNGNLPNGMGGGTLGGTIVDCVYTNNKCGYNGGGAYGGTLTGCTMVGNGARQGGAAYNAVLRDCTLTCNVATNGAAAYGGELHDCRITGNSAISYGGGTCMALLYGCEIENNFAKYGGGVCDGEATGCMIVNNTATAHGGGVYEGKVTDCEISNNSAGSYGGGTCIATVRRCVVNYNSAVHGGGICDGDIFACIIIGNTANGYGGGVYQSNIETSWIQGNSAYVGGGTYYGIVNSCVLCDNEASGAGGGAGFGRLVNCTVYGNYAYDIGGATYGGNMENSIATGNSAGLSTVQTYNTEVKYSCLPESVSGEGNIVADPKFVNPQNGDFHLMEDSPCIDVGEMRSGLTDTDCEGDRRVKYGTVDMGAYETTLSSRAEVIVEDVKGGIVTPMSSTTEAGGTMTFTAVGPRPFLGFYTNGVFITSNPVFVWENVTITGTLEARFDTSVPAKIYVDAASGNDENSGSDKHSAKASIVGAVQVACDGDEVYVAPGTYKPISVPNLRLTIQSESGAESTIIDGSEGGRCASFADETAKYYEPVETNTVLIGFTLRNGSPTSTVDSQNYNRGGGVYGGTIIDCILTSNTSKLEGGAAVCSILIGCKIYGNYSAEYGGGASYCKSSRCVFEYNWTGSYGGAIDEGEADNCLIIRNNAQWGGGSSSASLVNCTVVGNTASSVGGGCWNGSIVNCIVRDNNASGNADIHNVNVRYSCTGTLHAGEGNIAADPSFVSASTANYRIAEDSACAHVGDNDAVASSIDLDGNTRIVLGRVSMGAYEPKKTMQPPVIPQLSEFEAAWGEWSDETISSTVLSTTHFASWSHLRSCVWQMRDALSFAEGVPAVPPSSNVVVLTLGQFSVPYSLYSGFANSVESYEEFGVPVWRMRIRESKENDTLVAMVGDVEVMTDAIPSYDKQKWAAYVYGNPPEWLSGNQLSEWYSVRSRSRIECFLTLIPEELYETYMSNKTAEERERLADETANKGVCLDGIQPNISADGLHGISVHVPSEQAVGLFGADNLLSQKWSYVGTASLASGTSAAGVVATNKSFFVSASGDLVDNDGDGIPDAIETKVFGTNPYKTDTSGGGLTDREKVYRLGLNPLVRDTAGDGIDDEEKILAGVDPRIPATAAELETTRATIRYYYDDDDRLIGTYIGTGGENVTTKLSPAGNPLTITERRTEQ